MLPETLNLTAYRGDTFRRSIDIYREGALVDDLTGWSFAAQAREDVDAPSPSATFDVSVSGSRVTLTLPANVTAGMPRDGVWDFQVTTPNDEVVTPYRGAFTVEGDVTR
jgi:hypothetical protein